MAVLGLSQFISLMVISLMLFLVMKIPSLLEEIRTRPRGQSIKATLSTRIGIMILLELLNMSRLMLASIKLRWMLQ
jgi:hypothetical protein